MSPVAPGAAHRIHERLFRALGRSPWALALCLLLRTAASAQSPAPETLQMRDAWARETAPGAKVGVAYLTVENLGPRDRLVSIATPAAERAELHTMRMDRGIMRMQRVETLPIAEGGTLKLEPRGAHIMLINLRAALRAGDGIELVLLFERAGRVSVRLPIVAIGQTGPPVVRRQGRTP